MSTAIENVVHTPTPPPARLQRPTRALIGWMRPEEAKAALAGPQANTEGASEYDQIVAAARVAVAARPSGVDQSDLISPPPPELASHIDQLLQNSAGQLFFNEGWTIAIADLTRVCAVQPHVFTDDAAKRTAVIHAGDPVSAAAVTLPIATPSLMGAVYNSAKQAWLFSSANPNLRVVGEAQGQGQGAHIFGFAVAIHPSFMQVASYNGRFVLRDGYHRAYGLLARGITHAAVFVRNFERFEDLRLPQGLLPQDAYLGTRPPVLPDYFNSDVSANASVLVTQKVVVIQALEVATLG